MNIKQFLDEDKPNVDALNDAELSAALKDALEQVNQLNPSEVKVTKALNNMGAAYERLKNPLQALKYYGLIVDMKVAALGRPQDPDDDDDDDDDED